MNYILTKVEINGPHYEMVDYELFNGFPSYDAIILVLEEWNVADDISVSDIKALADPMNGECKTLAKDIRIDLDPIKMRSYTNGKPITERSAELGVFNG